MQSHMGSHACTHRRYTRSPACSHRSTHNRPQDNAGGGLGGPQGPVLSSQVTACATLRPENALSPTARHLQGPDANQRTAPSFPPEGETACLLRAVFTSRAHPLPLRTEKGPILPASKDHASETPEPPPLHPPTPSAMMVMSHTHQGHNTAATNEMVIIFRSGKNCISHTQYSQCLQNHSPLSRQQTEDVQLCPRQRLPIGPCLHTHPPPQRAPAEGPAPTRSPAPDRNHSRSSLLHIRSQARGPRLRFSEADRQF